MIENRCGTCGWLFTDEQWLASGGACPIHDEPEPSTPRRNWSWQNAQLAHGAFVDYVGAVRRFLESAERVANTSPALGLAADPLDAVGWQAATDLENATAAALHYGATAAAWPEAAV